MKVYFVGSAYMGCNYVRCWLPSQANGWKYSYRGLEAGSRKDPRVVRHEMMDSDIIVFHRADTAQHHRLAIALKEQGKKIVYDNDDTFVMDESHAFFNLDEKGFAVNRTKLNNVTNNFIINADMITASTKMLAEEYRKLNKNIEVLPNYVEPLDWPEPLRNEDARIRIGLVGSVAYSQDFEPIRELLVKLDKEDKVQLVLFGLWKGKMRDKNPLVEKVHRKEFAFWDSLANKEHVQWCEMGSYFYNLNKLRLDMMLIPRTENYFNTCKSNLKFLEAGMLEIPVIASSFKDGPYEELDGLNGLLATNDWEEKVELLIKDKEMRNGIGKNAKQYVLENYDINKNAHKWVEAYLKII